MTNEKARYTALVVAGGSGSRSGFAILKQFMPLLGRTVIAHSIAVFSADPACEAIVIAVSPDQTQACRTALGDLAQEKITIIETAGDTRQATVRNSLAAPQLAHLRTNHDATFLIHDAARPCLTQQLVNTLMLARRSGHEAIIPALAVTDTLRRIDKNNGVAIDVDRSGVHAIQTPQAFDAALLNELHERYKAETVTDDAALFARAGITATYIDGSRDNIKITYAPDLDEAAGLLSAMRGDVRSATGYDVHEFTPATPARPMRLGGITIDHDKALAGHSDADALLHAITDALLGCIAAQDIGHHFSPKDARWKDADSTMFLAHARDMITARGGIISHIDATVICEEPKIGPHRAAMQTAIAGILRITTDRVSIKATTSEGLGFTGRREGLAAQATATIRLPFSVPSHMKADSHAA